MDFMESVSVCFPATSCVIQDQFPAVALLKLFPFFRLYFGKLFVDAVADCW
jgi:hypothetical protein